MAWLARRTGGDPDLDDDYLDRLGDVVGPACFSEFLSDGLIEITDRLDRLDRAAKAGDRIEIGRIARDLTALAGQLGLTRLSLAAAGVAHAAHHSENPLEPMIRQLARGARPGFDSLFERVGRRNKRSS